ncbi:hypothetical protein BGW80DRAFT_1515700 [Lactifluus volemus]|nr:hypothetical protein BGW80DRAFT_1515700 [Lactifluus volemus]
MCWVRFQHLASLNARYPWLFGPLRVKLSLEHQWFPSLVRSLLAITGRSENQEFRSKTQALVKVEDPTSSMWIETEYYLQKIQSQVSVYKQLVLLLSKHLWRYALLGRLFSSDSTHLPEEENIWSGDLEEDGNGLDPACQVNSAEVAEDIISNISQTSRSSWDSGVDDKDNDESMSYVSDPLKSESCTRMPYQSRGIHDDENFIALDHNLEAPDICIFDEDDDSLLLVFD